MTKRVYWTIRPGSRLLPPGYGTRDRGSDNPGAGS